jgi:hypothetical protein
MWLARLAAGGRGSRVWRRRFCFSRGNRGRRESACGGRAGPGGRPCCCSLRSGRSLWWRKIGRCQGWACWIYFVPLSVIYLCKRGMAPSARTPLNSSQEFDDHPHLLPMPESMRSGRSRWPGSGVLTLSASGRNASRSCRGSFETGGFPVGGRQCR